MRVLYLETLCKCAACQGETTEPEADCKFVHVGSNERFLYRTWSLYVEDGNTPLTQLPAWVAEVGDLIRDYRGKREHKRLRDAEEKKATEELLKQYGML